MTNEHERFMRLALEEAEAGGAEGNMAVGAVIIRDGQVLARGRNEANSARDLTAHAETVAIRRLSVRLSAVNPSMRAGQGPLAGAVLYTTCEPCPMCAWAICIAGISAVVIGARFADMEIGYGDYSIERLLAMTGQPLAVVSHVLRAECEASAARTARLRPRGTRPGARRGPRGDPGCARATWRAPARCWASAAGASVVWPVASAVLPVMKRPCLDTRAGRRYCSFWSRHPNHPEGRRACTRT